MDDFGATGMFGMIGVIAALVQLGVLVFLIIILLDLRDFLRKGTALMGRVDRWLARQEDGR